MTGLDITLLIGTALTAIGIIIVIWALAHDREDIAFVGFALSALAILTMIAAGTASSEEAREERSDVVVSQLVELDNLGEFSLHDLLRDDFIVTSTGSVIVITDDDEVLVK